LFALLKAEICSSLVAAVISRLPVGLLGKPYSLPLVLVGCRCGAAPGGDGGKRLKLGAAGFEAELLQREATSEVPISLFSLQSTD
jgi:hypothetical protein